MPTLSWRDFEYFHPVRRAVKKKQRRLLLSNATWYTHYISVICFFHATQLCFCYCNNVTYLSTCAVYVTMVTRTRRSCILSDSSLNIGGYTTNLKWKSTYRPSLKILGQQTANSLIFRVGLIKIPYFLPQVLFHMCHFRTLELQCPGGIY